MSKEDNRPSVAWNLSGDALEPRPAPFGFIVRNPFAVSLAAKQGRLIKTGVSSSSCALLVWPTRTHLATARPEKEGQQWPIIVNAGEEVNVVIVNPSEHSPTGIEDKEGLLCVFPLVWNGTATVA